ncbi:MAG: hypothetical protein FWG82_04285 [Oscillospiraceae bacterium]|nr:hypothetical protein [Oscillospiraceae bacterium]
MSQKLEPKGQQQGIQFSKKTIISLSILLIVVLMAVGALTQIVPRGEYQLNDVGEVIPGTYEETAWKMEIWKIFAAPALIFTSPQALMGFGIILFIILIGGTFLVLDKSGVLEFCLCSVAEKYAEKRYTLLALVTLICMLLGSVIGILEESVTLVPLAAAIALTLGWDSLMGLGMSFLSVAIGFSAATFNPFNVVIMQKWADLPIFSGLIYRVFVFVLMYALLYGFLYFYGKRIDKNPKKSLAYETDKVLREKYASIDRTTALKLPKIKSATQIFVGCIAGVIVISGIAFLLRSVMEIPAALDDVLGFMPLVSMAVLFPLGGLLAAKHRGMTGKEISKGFFDGVKTIAPAIPMLLLLLCITYILHEGKIIHTLLFHVHNLMADFTPIWALFAIFAFVFLLEFFVGSGTAKVLLIIPIVLPLSRMLELSAQSLTLAFCLSDGIGNVFYPTSGLMILAIGLLGVSYGKFMRWFAPMFLLAFALSALVMWIAVLIGY